MRGTLGLLALGATSVSGAFSLSLTYPDGVDRYEEWSSGGSYNRTWLEPVDVDYCEAGGTAASFVRGILAGEAPYSGATTWNFTLGSAAPGTLTALTYKAYASATQVGADVAFEWRTYLSLGTEYRWVQVVVTNAPYDPSWPTTGYVDGEAHPFYYSYTHECQLSTSFTEAPYIKYFSDGPRRGGGNYSWAAYTFLTSGWISGPSTQDIVLHDGVKWGWTSTHLTSEGSGGGNRPVPEPATGFALLVGLTVLCKRRFHR